jgi:hypothetical protein
MKRRSFIQTAALSPLISIPGIYQFKKNTFESFVVEQERKIRVSATYDVIVCGGGPAGVCAAIEAGRNGAKTLLIEAHGCLGGVWTAGLLTWILDHVNKAGLMREIEDKLLREKGVSQQMMNKDAQIAIFRSLSFDPEIMKLVLDNFCLDAGVDILFHTRVVAAIKSEKGRLSHIVTESKSGREAWMGKIFIDCTGDGDLAALSGCDYDLGKESDGATQPFSLLALVTGINFDEIREFPTFKPGLLAEIERGGIVPSYLRPGLFPIRDNLFTMMANHEYGYSSVNAVDVTRATLHARKEVNAIVNALRRNGGVWKNIQLVATAEQIGTREGRRIHGLYTVSKEDLIKGSRFEDAVCRVTFGVDVHSVSKQDEESKSVDYHQNIKSENYDIPLRSLIAKDVGGLMMAGRCISGDFIAHSSYRVTGNAIAMGQAAGRTAALSSKKNILPQEVNFKSLGL